MDQSPAPDQSTPSKDNDGYSQFLANGQGTLNLWGTLWQAGQQTAQSISEYQDKRRSTSAAILQLQNRLGPWYTLLVEGDERSRLPVLRTEAFLSYLEARDGIFVPGPTCKATEGWAVCLHALGIEPNTIGDSRRGQIVSWRHKNRPNSTTSPAGMGSAAFTSLELDGEVVCHVLNLFGQIASPKSSGELRYSNGRSQDNDRFTKKYTTGFGTFTLSDSSNEVIYDQADRSAICQKRVPFENLMQLMESGTIIAKHYYNAIYSGHGTSDTTLVWPIPTSTLKERLTALISHKERVSLWKTHSDPTYGQLHNIYRAAISAYWDSPADSRGKYPDEPELPPTKPLLLTEVWLDGANRIWRRALTNNGQDFSLKEELLASVEKRLTAQPDDSEKILKNKMKARLMAEFDIERRFTSSYSFSPIVHVRHVIESPQLPILAENAAREAVTQSFKEVIGSYINEPEGSWKRQLHDAGDVFYEVFNSSTDIRYDTDLVQILPFTPESPIWNTKVMLSGEDPGEF